MKCTFEKIYDNYHQDLYRFIFFMVKDAYLTEDLIQEVYVKVLQSYESFSGNSSEKTWLFSIARFTTIDHFRSEKRKRTCISSFFDWGEKGDRIRDNASLPDEIAINNDDIQKVYQYLDRCTIDQRSVLILRFIQSLSLKETADILDFTISKVKTTQHRALKVIRKHLLENEQKGSF